MAIYQERGSMANNKYKKINDDTDWKKRVITPRTAASSFIESPERDKVVIIKRKYEPFGYALPGGIQELGETVIEAAKREAKEETTIDVEPLGLLTISSDPDIDPRWHINIVYVVCKMLKEAQRPKGQDDALQAFWMDWRSDELAEDFTEGFRRALNAYRSWRQNGWPLMETAESYR